MTHFKIKDLVRADYNPRIMPDKEMQSLMESIRVHGFVEPIVVNTSKERYGVIVGGHQRLTAVERLLAKGVEIVGIKDGEIPAFHVKLDLEAEKQLNIGLNKIHGTFDENKLYDLIFEMKGSATLPTTGFRDDEVSRLLDRNMPEEEDEEKLVLEGEPTSKPGEIYELGEHRLICGSSTDPATYQKLFGSVRPDMIWTDPPYGVVYKSHDQSGQRKTELEKAGKESIMNDDMKPEDFKKLTDESFSAMFGIAKQGAPFYVCSGWSSYPQFLDSMLRYGFYLSGMIIWVKPANGLSFADYKQTHEWIAKAKKPDVKTASAIIYGWSKGVHSFFGENEFDVWEMPRKGVSKYLHPTEKPDWLPMRAIRNSTKRGDIILDPFAGSGSVMAAAEKTGRRAFMIELDPKFCDVIRKRYDRILKAQQNKDADDK